MARKVDIDSELDNNSFDDERGGMPAQKRRTAPGLRAFIAILAIIAMCFVGVTIYTHTRKAPTRPKPIAAIKTMGLAACLATSSTLTRTLAGLRPRPRTLIARRCRTKLKRITRPAIITRAEPTTEEAADARRNGDATPPKWRSYWRKWRWSDSYKG